MKTPLPEEVAVPLVAVLAIDLVPEEPVRMTSVLEMLAPEPSESVAATVPAVSPMRMVLLLAEPALLIWSVPALRNVSPL